MVLNLAAANPCNSVTSAIVLAGGMSSRMGQDKALVVVGGKPLLLRVCQAALCCTNQVYVVAPWVDRYHPLLDGLSVHLIQEQPSPNQLPHGPIVGFQQGLTQVQTEWVLLLACDLPQLRVEVLQQWLKILPQVSPETIACLPKNPQGWWEPLCGFYHRRCQSSLETFVAEGGRSFQRWLAQQSVVELPLEDPSMLFNCNRPSDLEKCTAACTFDS